MLASVVAQGSSAVLVVGFPFLLSLTTEATVYAAGALSCSRSPSPAPPADPAERLSGRRRGSLRQQPRQGLRALLPILRLIGLIGVVGGALAWFVGPWLMVLLTGKETYRVDGWILAALTIGAALLAILTLTGPCARRSPCTGGSSGMALGHRGSRRAAPRPRTARRAGRDCPRRRTSRRHSRPPVPPRQARTRPGGRPMTDPPTAHLGSASAWPPTTVRVTSRNSSPPSWNSSDPTTRS
ncbi:hypothetical protein NKG05_21045 [Oerskovia sp. M15]